MPLVQWASPTGVPSLGATLNFYVTGTNTPAVVYSDSALTTPLLQPIAMLSQGYWPDIFLDPSITYKCVLHDGGGNLIWTEDPVSAVSVPTSFMYLGFTYAASAPPGADAFLGGWWMPAAATFPPNMASPDSGFHANTLPTSSYVISFLKNGVQVATVTVAAAGTYTYATAGGVQWSVVKGDSVTRVGQHVADATLNNFFGTLVGTFV